MANDELVDRRTRSAEIDRSLEWSGWDVMDDEPRPVTAVPAFKVPSQRTKETIHSTSTRGEKRSITSPTSSKRSPRPANLDEWNNDETEPLQPALVSRRESRIDALARHKASVPYPKDPSKQVLQQRTLAVMELTPPEAIRSDTVTSKSGHKNLLISHGRRHEKDADDAKLPTIQKRSSNPVVVRGVGLFGPHIEDSHEIRALMFRRFLPVWSLLPSSLNPNQRLSDASSPPGSPFQSPSSSIVGRDRKSALDCGMILMKICKAIGITLSSSPPPHVWSSSKRRASLTATIPKTVTDVDLDTFGEFVVRNALQPAMHHFRLDRDLDEYLHTIDAVVHSLVTRVDTDPSSGGHVCTRWRLRELSEVQPVLPLWKKGIPSVQKPSPLVQTSPSASTFRPIDTSDTTVYSIIQTEETAVVHASELDVTHSKRLPAYEARALQDANIRRKLQLRKSWEPKIVVANAHKQPVAPQDGDADTSHALGSCIHVVAAPHPHSFDMLPNGDVHSMENNQVAETEDVPDEKNVPLLLCGACIGDTEATLWCSACFAVFCTACWTATHHSTVDFSLVNNQHDLPAPTTRPLQTHRTAMAPPVAMLYLPTKPLVNGKLVRGSTSTTERNQPEDHGDKIESKALMNSLSSHTLLPSLRSVHQKSRLAKDGRIHQSSPALPGSASSPSSSMESTANLLKALMLGTASSASVLGLSSTASPWSVVSYTTTKDIEASGARNHDSKRTHLHPKAITLDATALLS